MTSRSDGRFGLSPSALGHLLHDVDSRSQVEEVVRASDASVVAELIKVRLEAFLSWIVQPARSGSPTSFTPFPLMSLNFSPKIDASVEELNRLPKF